MKKWYPINDVEMKCFIAMLVLQDIVKSKNQYFKCISRKEKIYSLLSSAKYSLQKDFYYFANLYILKNNRNVREKFLKLKISWKMSKYKHLYVSIQDICIDETYCYEKNASYFTIFDNS